MSDGKKDHPEDLDGTAKDIAKFRSEFKKVRAAWRNNLTTRGGLHWWVDLWKEGADASTYAIAKIVAVAIPLAFILGCGIGTAAGMVLVHILQLRG